MNIPKIRWWAEGQKAGLKMDDVLENGRTVEEEIAARVMFARLSGIVELPVAFLNSNGDVVARATLEGNIDPDHGSWEFKGSIPSPGSVTISASRYINPITGKLKEENLSRPYHLIAGDTFNFSVTITVS